MKLFEISNEIENIINNSVDIETGEISNEKLIEL